VHIYITVSCNVRVSQGWHVSSMDGNNHGKNRVISVTEEILSFLPFWEEMEETPKFDRREKGSSQKHLDLSARHISYQPRERYFGPSFTHNTIGFNPIRARVGTKSPN